MIPSIDMGILGTSCSSCVQGSLFRHTSHCLSTQREHMATLSPLSLSEARWSLNDLSSELLAIIFEHLRDMDSWSLVSVRQTCHRFDGTATPIAYETVKLNERITAPDAKSKYSRAFDLMALHTKHVAVRSDLRPEGIRQALESVPRLQTVSWRYIDDIFCSGYVWMPSDVMSPHHPGFANIRLLIEDLPLRNFDGLERNFYLRAIPTGLLTSLKLGKPTPPLATRLQSLKDLILDARHLETFHYQDRGQGTHFTFSGTERLPPFKHLSLKSYDWAHDSDEVKVRWDFSRIRSLSLLSLPVYNFLSSVSFSDFSNLQHLHVEDFSAHLHDRRKEATQRLYDLVKNHIRALRSLEITCHIHYFPVDALLTHAGTLEILRFRDHVGFAEDDRRCPTMWIEDLAMLSRRLVVLNTLELDMDSTKTEPPLFLRALAAFPRLHSLTLHVQTVLHPQEIVHAGSDRDQDAAMGYFDSLMRNKATAVARPSQVVPWRSITVNVGGWRKVMLRRFGEAWRRQNSRGVFAERCFVLERAGSVAPVAVGTDSYQVREEQCVETGFRDNRSIDDFFPDAGLMHVDPNPIAF